MTSSKNSQQQSNSQRSGKEPYVTPSIRFAEIEVEQALMGLCKTPGGVGTFGACDSGFCRAPGS
ncbi:MAG: hypothetical protein JXX29_21345 [Deltaproteobacteria bacterium]|nr:hypothetical protein [Deltaproteobacteria bacterium]MBN2674242.1 hypothetical protein [Deltaproteobacteria bacterium]